MIRHKNIILYILVILFCKNINGQTLTKLTNEVDSSTISFCDSLLKPYKDTNFYLIKCLDSIENVNIKINKKNEIYKIKIKELRDSIQSLKKIKTEINDKKNITNKTNIQKQKEVKPTNKLSKRIVIKGNSYDIVTLNYPIDNVKMILNDKNNNKIRTIDNGVNFISKTHKDIAFITNGGMYKIDNSPQGLYVENGKEIAPIDLNNSGYGNFYLQPNGIFLLTESKAFVIPTYDYINYKSKSLYATQSGPLLVNNGVINSNFTNGSVNKNIRSGVGIDNAGKLIFAISNNEVNFYDFAEFFYKTLKCKNALYLDGAISRMYLPSLNRLEKGGDFGVLIYSAKK